MAKLVKGTIRYLLLRGKDESGNDIVIDAFDRKSLDTAVKEGRVTGEDYIVKIQVLGKADLSKPKSPAKK
jgi:hypothetical protein